MPNDEEEKPCEHCGEVHSPTIVLPNDESVHNALDLWKRIPPERNTLDYYNTAFARAYDIAESQGMPEDEAWDFALSFLVVCGVSVSRAFDAKKKQAEKTSATKPELLN